MTTGRYPTPRREKSHTPPSQPRNRDGTKVGVPRDWHGELRMVSPNLGGGQAGEDLFEARRVAEGVQVRVGIDAGAESATRVDGAVEQIEGPVPIAGTRKTASRVVEQGEVVRPERDRLLEPLDSFLPL